MNGTVLCGVQGPTEDRHAVELALDICRRLDLRLVVANIVHVPGRGGLDLADETYARDRQGATVMLKRLAQDLELDDSVTRRVSVGDAAGSLARIATEEAADLIVIGSGRPTPLWRRRGISFPDRLAVETTVPVVTALPTSRSGRRSRELVGNPV